MNNKIKVLRLEKGITQEELALLAGVSRTIISGLENGSRTNTTAATIVKIAKALDASVEEIFFTDTV